MHRAPVAIVAAAAGLAGAVGFHVSGSAPLLLSSSTGQSPSHPAVSTTTSVPASSNRKITSPTSGSAGRVSTAPRTVTGPTELYGYGQLAVRVTVSGAKIIGLNVVGLQTAESYSQQIADQVIPMLHGEVFAAQSAQVNGISGATYTTEAYLYSIQAALDKLHVK